MFPLDKGGGRRPGDLLRAIENCNCFFHAVGDGHARPLQ